MSEGSADDPDEVGGDAELGAAVDDALRAEAKRQFMARFLGVDRAEGTGRGEEHWNEALYRDQQRELGRDPDDPPD